MERYLISPSTSHRRSSTPGSRRTPRSPRGSKSASPRVAGSRSAARGSSQTRRSPVASRSFASAPLRTRAFEAWFGKRSTVAWLPDVFGFSGGIPQLLRADRRFLHHQAQLERREPLPYDLFTWEGIDGSRVTANMFRNLSPAHGYNGNIALLDTLGTWRRGKRQPPGDLLAFGWGDGGGGPSARMLENYAPREFPALPRLRMAHIEEFSPRCRNRVCRSGWGALPGVPPRHADHQARTSRSTVPASTGSSKRSLRGHRPAHRVPYPHDEIETAWKTSSSISSTTSSPVPPSPRSTRTRFRSWRGWCAAHGRA